MLFTGKCNQCDFEVGVADDLVSAIYDESWEMLLPHPGEDRVARLFFGKSSASLSHDDRWRYRATRLCLSCGEIGYYIWQQSEYEGVAEKHIERYDYPDDDRPYYIIARENVKHTPQPCCALCGSGSLETPGDSGVPIPCPQCKIGQFEWHYAGIS